MRSIVLLALIGATIAVVSQQSAAEDPKKTDVLRVAINADPVGLQPAMHFHAPGKLVVQHVAESLVAHRNDMSIAPALAESWTESDDRRSYTFKLREDARFHNGARVKADDVAAAWNDYYLDPDTDWHCRVFYTGDGSIEERTVGAEIESVRATADDTIEFRLARPSNLFLARMADVSCAPVIFHPDSRNADGSWNELIGTGPYRIAEWRKGKRIVLQKFDGYQPRKEARDGYSGAKVAYAEEIELLIEPDRAAQIAALKAGSIDMVLDLQEDERTLLEGVEGIDLHTTTTINFWNLLIQTRDPLLSDLRIRKAIAHAIDNEYLAAALTEGRQTGNPSVISANSHFHSDVHSQGHRFDLGLARQLLAEAGYDGEPVEIQANLDAYPEMYRIGVLVRSMLRAAGINAVLNVMPWEEQLDDHYRSGTFQLQAFGQGGRNHPALVYGKFIGPKDEKARFQWDDDDAFKLVEQAHDATSIAEQQRLYDELHTRMLESVPTLALLNFEYHDATRNNINGFITTPFMRTTLWGVWKD